MDLKAYLEAMTSRQGLWGILGILGLQIYNYYISGSVLWQQLLFLAFFSFVLDTITGIFAAKLARGEAITAKKFSMCIRKYIGYTSLILVATLLDMVLSLQGTPSRFAATFGLLVIFMTEFKSCIENISELVGNNTFAHDIKLLIETSRSVLKSNGLPSEKKPDELDKPGGSGNSEV